MLQLAAVFDGPYKVDLPETLLESVLGEFSPPLTFRLDSPDGQRQFVGVRQFTAGEGEVHMNARLAANLGLELGDTVSIENVKLPRGTELTLDLVTAHTAGLDLKSLLESWIPQNYAALGHDDVLDIDYLGESHKLKVAGFKPEGEAVCVLDTDMDLIVNENKDSAQIDTTGEIKVGQAIESANILTGDTPNTDFVYFYCSQLGFIGPEHATSPSSFIAVSNNENVKVNTEFLGPKFSVCGSGTLSVTTRPPPESGSACEFCGKIIPEQNLFLHSNFCARNSAKCGCGRKFGQTREVPESHRAWHALTDSCESTCTCSYVAQSPAALAFHRATDCPERQTICQFCHLLVPQGETSPVDRTLGLTAHESQCGNRTTECYQCNRRIRLRSLETHIRDHDIQRMQQPVPQLCSNRNCPNEVTVEGIEGLCNSCFGPLSVPGSNTDLGKVRQRVVRRYVLQMMQGCRKPFCTNTYCAVNTKRTAKEAMDLTGEIMKGSEHFFCVNEESTRRRMFVDFDDNHYAPGWRARAISRCGSETEAAQWLVANAN